MQRSVITPVSAGWLLGAITWVLVSALSVHAQPAGPDPKAESIFFTPAGFRHEGKAIWAKDADAGKVHISVRDRSSGELTPCRICVVGSDGNFYQPASNELSQHALVGDWPQDGARGNRKKTGPYRYLGRYFYSTGEVFVDVPPGETRVEVAKGFEFATQTITVTAKAKESCDVMIDLSRTAAMAPFGYSNGDTHLHFLRASERDEKTTLDVLAAEDIQFGALLGYNHPPGPYAGFREELDYPQLRGVGSKSIRTLGPTTILSGQEYRSKHFGHLNLFLLDEIVFPGEKFNADDGPAYGRIAMDARDKGAISIMAHGGYEQEIYADAALGAVDAVELLQFGVYRPIGLAGWYDMLNSGYRFPAVGASDFPACRFLGDSRTYVWTTKSKGLRDIALNSSPEASPVEIASFQDWLRGLTRGQSFITTGPLLLIEVEGNRPGEIGRYDSDSQAVTVQVFARSEVAAIQHIDLIVNGEVVKRVDYSDDEGTGKWLRFAHSISVDESSWIAARAYGVTSEGSPNAESHTNPVYVYLKNRTPYRANSLEAWIARIDAQIDKQSKRPMKHKQEVLAFYERARQTLLEIRRRGGLMADDTPGTLVRSGEQNAVLSTEKESRIIQ